MFFTLFCLSCPVSFLPDPPGHDVYLFWSLSLSHTLSQPLSFSLSLFFLSLTQLTPSLFLSLPFFISFSPPSLSLYPVSFSPPSLSQRTVQVCIFIQKLNYINLPKSTFAERSFILNNNNKKTAFCAKLHTTI